MKKPILLTLLCTFLLVLNGVAQNTNIQSIINKAGAQRAISQRMAKDYMLIGLGIRVEESLKDLDESSSVFNENLHEIIFYNKSKKTEDAVAKVNELWTRFRVNVNETPKKENATKIILASTALMNACQVVVENLIESNTEKNKNLQLIARCGLQRKNSQRMAMLYAAKAWDTSFVVDHELNEAIESVESTLDYLLKNPTNTPEIEKILKFHRSEWIFLRKTFDVSTGALKPDQVSSSAKLIFKDFNELTFMYEKLAS
jgi:lipopolysaccharide biosynthesis regulator YciM